MNWYWSDKPEIAYLFNKFFEKLLKNGKYNIDDDGYEVIKYKDIVFKVKLINDYETKIVLIIKNEIIEWKEKYFGYVTTTTNDDKFKKSLQKALKILE